MPEIPDVSAIAQQVKARIKQIEEQLKQHQRLTDELERLRGALSRLEGEARSRVSERPPQPEASGEAGGQRHAHPGREARECAGTRPARSEQGQGARCAQGWTDDCLGDRKATGISTGTVSTMLTKMAKSGELAKAERGYKLPD